MDAHLKAAAWYEEWNAGHVTHDAALEVARAFPTGCGPALRHRSIVELEKRRVAEEWIKRVRAERDKDANA
jgi:hypothetical protein